MEIHALQGSRGGLRQWLASRYRLPALLVVLLAAGLGGLLVLRDGDPPYKVGDHARYEATDCWADVGEADFTECGWLAVPERWDKPEGKRITLPVAVFRPREPDPALAPVIHLAGGPGWPALIPADQRFSMWRWAADEVFPGRSLVVLDQRGIGLGSPRLACPEGDHPSTWWPLSEDPEQFDEVRARVHRAYGLCRDRLLGEGVDLAAYSSRQIAADVEALRRSLDLGPAILFGISYGTRVALTVMQNYPEGVIAAVLDSVLPPQSERSALNAEALGATFDRLFEACAADRRCASAYPDLEARFFALLDRLRQEPIVLEVVNLDGPQPRYARIDDKVFLEILRSEMYFTSKLPYLPTLISGMSIGEDWRLKPHAEATFHGNFPRIYDMGMLISTVCHDEAGREGPDQQEIEKGPYAYLADYVTWVRELEPCRIWPQPESTAAGNLAVRGQIPSLLLAGGLDASTPLSLAEEAAEGLSKAELFVFPASAHGLVFSDRCAREVLRAFLANAAKRPNPDCLHSLRQPSFLAIGGK